MSKLEVRAEIIKLGRLFDLPENRLQFLQTLPAASIKAYRECAEAKLFSEDITLFRRLSLASKLIPAGLVGLIGQHVFGPVLSARVAGEMEYPRAVKLAMKLPVDYLADICLHLDPKQTEDIIRNVPAARIREVCALLLERGEYITMGRFVSYLTDDAILVAIEAFEQESDLLMVGFFAEDKPRLDHIIRMLDDDRLQRTIVAAQSTTGDASEGLWAEAVALMVYVQDDLKRKLGDMAASQDMSVLAGLLDTAHTQQLWSDVLPVVACMSPDAQRKVSELPALTQPEVMAPILQTAHDQQLWHALLPLVETMPQAQLETAAHALTDELPQEALEVVLQTAARQRIWSGILPLFDAMGPQQAQRIGEAIAVLPQSALEDAVQSTDENNLWSSLLPLAEHMPQAQREQLAGIIAELPEAALERLVHAAAESDNDLQANLLNMLPLIPEQHRPKVEKILKPLFDGSVALPAKKPARTQGRIKPANKTPANPTDTSAESASEPASRAPVGNRLNPPPTSAAKPGRPFRLHLPGVLDSVYKRVENTFPVTTALSFFGLDEVQREYENLRSENQKLQDQLVRSQGSSESHNQQKDQALATLRREKQALEEQLRQACQPSADVQTKADDSHTNTRRSAPARSNEASGSRNETGPESPKSKSLEKPTTTPGPAAARQANRGAQADPRVRSAPQKSAQRTAGNRATTRKPGSWRQGGLTRSGAQRQRPVPPLKSLSGLPAPPALKRPPAAKRDTAIAHPGGARSAGKIFLAMSLVIAAVVGAMGLLVLWLMSRQ